VGLGLWGLGWVGVGVDSGVGGWGWVGVGLGLWGLGWCGDGRSGSWGLVWGEGVGGVEEEAQEEAACSAKNGRILPDLTPPARPAAPAGRPPGRR